MSTTVIDRNGVKLAGPDSPALADRDAVVLAPVGAVSPAQAGILEYTGQIQANTISGKPTTEMIDRGHAAAPGLDRGTIEDIVMAALGLVKHPHTGV